MHRYLNLFSVCCLLLLASCGRGGAGTTEVPRDSVTFRYAKLLHIYHYDHYSLVVIDNPWQAGQVLHRYVVAPQSAGNLHGETLPEGTRLQIPLKRLTVFTSIHASLLCDLHAQSSITGLCDMEYVQSPVLKRLVAQGKIKDMGSALNPNMERILSASTDGMLVSPFEKSGYGMLERANIPLIECADYMEHSALGRAEWMRFFGMLINRQHEADSLFLQVEKEYKRLSNMAATAREHPSLLSDFMSGAAWYVPGATSTMGQLYKDAGANYIFAGQKQNGSVRLSFETVFNRAHNADVWLIKYGTSRDLTYTDLRKQYGPYADFAAFKHRRVYGCNTFRVPFYEEEPFHPDYLLKDFIKILHPQLLPSHKLRYFCPLDE